MSADFQPIHAFDGQLQFQVAYNWSKDEIIHFLSRVASNPATFGAPNDTASKENFKLLYETITHLIEGGTRYSTPTPVQQILRKNQTTPALDPTKKIPWTVNNISEAYFIIFDLLGVFLSLMGPAPITATAKNYFLPLVVVYARWCGKLAKSKSFAPTVAQITWSKKDNSNTWHSFLGTSAKGFEATWKDVVGQTRHGYLSGILKAPWAEYGKSPSKDKNEKAGTNFGNCGETYPFLYVLADSTLKENSHGIALTVASTHKNESYNGENYWKERGGLLPPCMNCEQLMDWYGVKARLPNFKLWT